MIKLLENFDKSSVYNTRFLIQLIKQSNVLSYIISDTNTTFVVDIMLKWKSITRQTTNFMKFASTQNAICSWSIVNICLNFNRKLK